MIRIEHLEKRFHNAAPLKDVNAIINDGDVVAVIGPSGTGKSTLLRCINRLEEPTGGRIWIGNTEITDPKCELESIRQKTGMVFQNFNLFGHLSVIENIMLSPVEILKMDRQEAYDLGIGLLRQVGLVSKADAYPNELSGGQKQRIAIARTLSMDPDVILMDEPTSALDPAMVGEVQSVIRDLASTGKTLIIVTHEMEFARSICNRVFFVDEGRIYEEGTPEKIFEHPEHERTRRFVRQLFVLELEIGGSDYDFPGLRGEIEAFCGRNRIPHRMSARIQLIFEEMVHGNLISHFPDISIRVQVEYSEKSGIAVFSAEYTGERYNALEEGDELSLSILKNITESAEYFHDSSLEYANRIKCII